MDEQAFTNGQGARWTLRAAGYSHKAVYPGDGPTAREVKGLGPGRGAALRAERPRREAVAVSKDGELWMCTSLERACRLMQREIVSADAKVSGSVSGRRQHQPSAGTPSAKTPMSAKPSSNARTISPLSCSSTSTRMPGSSAMNSDSAAGRNSTSADMFAHTRTCPRTLGIVAQLAAEQFETLVQTDRVLCRNAPSWRQCHTMNAALEEPRHESISFVGWANFCRPRS